MHCKSQENANCSRLDDRVEGLGVINSVFLIKTLSNKASFVTIKRAIGFLLKAIHPFISNDFAIWRSRTKSPSAIGYQGLVF